MRIDLERETLVPLREAPRLFPAVAASGTETRRPSYRTIGQWASRGVNGVVLESVCVGDRVHTTQEAVWRFLESLTAAREHRHAGEAAGPEQGTRAQRVLSAARRARSAARAKLAEKYGV